MKWTHFKRRRGSTQPQQSHEQDEQRQHEGQHRHQHQPAALQRSSELDVNVLLQHLPIYLSVAQLARLLWTNAYQVIFILELKQFSNIGSGMLELFQSVRSSRQGELCNNAPALLRLASTTAAVARERSQKIIPFSIMAKSISWMMQRVPTRVFTGERKQRRLVSKELCISVLDEMLLCRPAPAFEVC